MQIHFTEANPVQSSSIQGTELKSMESNRTVSNPIRLLGQWQRTVASNQLEMNENEFNRADRSHRVTL